MPTPTNPTTVKVAATAPGLLKKLLPDDAVESLVARFEAVLSDADAVSVGEDGYTLGTTEYVWSATGVSATDRVLGTAALEGKSEEDDNKEELMEEDTWEDERDLLFVLLERADDDDEVVSGTKEEDDEVKEEEEVTDA